VDDPGEKIVEVRDLWFSYDRRNGRGWALKGVDLDLFAGEVVAVVGDNGSGKTTLMHHLAGLFKLQKGRVVVAGRDVRRHNAYRLAGTVGIVFQNPALMLTADNVFDEVAFGPKNLKMPPEELKRNVSECLRLMELEDLTGYHPQTLSGGQRLRCAVAAIISMKPQLVLLDEPTSGQDILHIRKLMELCRKLAGRGKTVVFITHDHEIAAEYADRILVMDEGRIAADCTSQEFLQRNEQRYSHIEAEGARKGGIAG
jgi:energy-coupling factor transport system ATP-binding protein